jgi:hypothetical protein
MHALLPHTAGRCLGPAQLRSQRASSTSRPLLQSGTLNASLQTPGSSVLRSGSSNSRLHSSSQSQADVADQYPELQPFSAVDSTVEALLTAELEADVDEPPELEALVAAASKAQQHAADSSQDENPYSPEDALRYAWFRSVLPYVGVGCNKPGLLELVCFGFLVQMQPSTDALLVLVATTPLLVGPSPLVFMVSHLYMLHTANCNSHQQQQNTATLRRD